MTEPITLHVLVTPEDVKDSLVAIGTTVWVDWEGHDDGLSANGRVDWLTSCSPEKLGHFATAVEDGVPW